MLNHTRQAQQTHTVMTLPQNSDPLRKNVSHVCITKPKTKPKTLIHSIVKIATRQAKGERPKLTTGPGSPPSPWSPRGPAGPWKENSPVLVLCGSVLSVWFSAISHQFSCLLTSSWFLAKKMKLKGTLFKNVKSVKYTLTRWLFTVWQCLLHGYNSDITMTSYRASLFTTTTTWAAFSRQTLKKANEKMLTSVIASNTKWVNYYCNPGNFRKQ